MKYVKHLVCFFVLVGTLFAAPRAEAFFYPFRISTIKALSHYAMGHIYDLHGLTSRAVLEYEKSLQFDGANFLARLRLGVNYARLNMLEQAVEQLQLAKKYNSEDLKSHYLLAIIYSTQGEYDKAAQEYEYILTMVAKDEPKSVEIYNYLGQLYYSQKKYDQAVKQFEKILKVHPKNVELLYLLGSLYVEVDKRDQAIELLKKAIEIDPEHDGSLNALGFIYTEDESRLDEAVDLINRALEINPDFGAYLDSLGWAYFKKGMYEKAAEFLNQADELLDDSVIYNHLADVYFKMNNVEYAIKYWQLSLELLPKQENVMKKLQEVKNSQASR